jgi:hypothetical protein
VLKLDGALRPLASWVLEGTDFGHPVEFTSIAVSDTAVAVGGRFSGPFDFRSREYTPADYNTDDGFVLGLDLDLSPAWIWTSQGVGFEKVLDLIWDGLAFHAVGYFSDRIVGPGGEASADGIHDGFLVKLNETGEPQWLQQFGGTGDDKCTGVAGYGDGQVIAVGYFHDTIDLLGHTVGPTGSLGSAFAVRLDTSGRYQSHWAGGGWTTGSMAANAVAVAPTGYTAIAGQWKDTVDFGGPSHTSGARSEGFVVMLDPDLGYWSDFVTATPDTTAYTEIHGAAIRPTGDIVAAGYLRSDVQLNSDTTIPPGAGLFAVRLDWSATVLDYALSNGTAALLRPVHDVVATPSGRTLITGRFYGAVGDTFGFGSMGPLLTTDGSNDGFIAVW